MKVLLLRVRPHLVSDVHSNSMAPPILAWLPSNLEFQIETSLLKSFKAPPFSVEEFPLLVKNELFMLETMLLDISIVSLLSEMLRLSIKVISELSIWKSLFGRLETLMFDIVMFLVSSIRISDSSIAVEFNKLNELKSTSLQSVKVKNSLIDVTLKYSKSERATSVEMILKSIDVEFPYLMLDALNTLSKATKINSLSSGFKILFISMLFMTKVEVRISILVSIKLTSLIVESLSSTVEA